MFKRGRVNDLQLTRMKAPRKGRGRGSKSAGNNTHECKIPASVDKALWRVQTSTKKLVTYVNHKHTRDLRVLPGTVQQNGSWSQITVERGQLAPVPRFFGCFLRLFLNCAFSWGEECVVSWRGSSRR